MFCDDFIVLWEPICSDCRVVAGWGLYQKVFQVHPVQVDRKKANLR